MHTYVFFKGEKGHGKSTAASALELVGYAHINFADPLREVAKTVYRLTDEEMSDPVLKEQVLARWPWRSPREILQRIGTEMFRSYIDDTWVRNFDMRTFDAMAGGARGVVCSDLRFANEAALARELGGLIIEIVDPRKPSGSDGHVSEVGAKLIVPDHVVVNDGSIRRLRATILEIVL